LGLNHKTFYYLAVYLALLRMYFSPLFIDEVRDAVLSQLLEHGLGAEELKVVREALEVSIEFIKREKSAGTDTEGCLNPLNERIISYSRRPYMVILRRMHRLRR
jgi:hypothetical protein